MKAALGYNEVLIKNSCYDNSRFTTCPLGVFKNVILHTETAANFTEI